MNLSEDRARTAVQILGGQLGPTKLRRKIQLSLLRLQNQGTEGAFEGLLQWVRLGLALQKMQGRPALDGHVVLDTLKSSRLAHRITIRHRKAERERGLRLQQFEHRNGPALSAAVERMDASNRSDRGVTTAQLFDRFSTDRRRLGYR